MKTRWWVLGFALWTLAALWLGRQSVPDRSVELRAWRDSAAVLLRGTAASTTRAERAEAQVVRAIARADTADRALAGLDALAERRGLLVDSLQQALAAAPTVGDTVALLTAIVHQQDTTITVLRDGVASARTAMAGLRADLDSAGAAHRVAHAESARLRAVILAGLEVTKPSRGGGATFRALGAGLLVGVVGWELVR